MPLAFTHTDLRLPTANIFSRNMIGLSVFMLTDNKILGLQLNRRPPDLFSYRPDECPFMMKSPSEECAKGKNCQLCHSTVERLYHPSKYKALACEVYYYSEHQKEKAMS